MSATSRCYACNLVGGEHSVGCAAVAIDTPTTPDPRERGEDEIARWIADEYDIPLRSVLTVIAELRESEAVALRPIEDAGLAGVGIPGTELTLGVNFASQMAAKHSEGVPDSRVGLPHASPVHAPAPSEAVLWAVYDAHGRMMTYTESRTKADAERARYEGYGDKVWVMNRPFSVVPLYTHPAPARGVTEDMVMIPRSLAHKADGLLSLVGHRHKVRGVGADAAEFIEASLEFRAALTPDAEGGA